MPKINDRQSAEPKQCGSCQHFRARDPGDGLGVCTLRLPPWVQSRPEPPESDSEVNARTVRDTDGCSLYEVRNLAGEPVEFVQERVWQAGMPSR